MKYKDYLVSHLGQFKSLIIELCHYCPVECAHCHVSSNKRSKLFIDDEILKESIVEFAKVPGSEIVMCTGGEPFTNRKKLKLALETINNNFLKAYVLTSANWARTYEKALTTLRRLPKISLLGVSTDKFHEERIGLQPVLNALRASLERGIDSFICIGHLGTDDTFRTHVLTALKENNLLDHIEVVYYPLLARGSGSNISELKGRELSRNAKFYCYSVGAPIILSNGKMSACCHTSEVNKIRNSSASPLMIKDLNGDVSIRKALNNYLSSPFLKVMRTLGPVELAHILELDTPRDFSSWDICKACSFVQQKCTEVSLDEILQRKDIIRKVEMLDIVQSYGTITKLTEYAND